MHVYTYVESDIHLGKSTEYVHAAVKCFHTLGGWSVLNGEPTLISGREKCEDQFGDKQLQLVGPGKGSRNLKPKRWILKDDLMTDDLLHMQERRAERHERRVLVRLSQRRQMVPIPLCAVHRSLQQ